MTYKDYIKRMAILGWKENDGGVYVHTTGKLYHPHRSLCGRTDRWNTLSALKAITEDINNAKA